MNWADQHKLQINIDKCKMMVFGNPRRQLVIESKQPIEQTKTARYLGVILDSRLNFGDHVREVIKECSRRLNLLKWLRGCPVDISRMLYVHWIRSKLEYGLSVVYPRLSQATRRLLQSFHRKAVKAVAGVFQSSRNTAQIASMLHLNPPHVRQSE